MNTVRVSENGSFDGGLPSLFHNTALGRVNTNNLVMVMLEGLHRQPDVLMPSFAKDLSDRCWQLGWRCLSSRLACGSGASAATQGRTTVQIR
ncbi:MAG: hypothetical protein ABI605_17810 [Rhizobacter sp.]